MADWIAEGTAYRSPVRIAPVRHLLVDGRANGWDWSMWCSGSRGRKDYNPHSRKFCRECLELAREACADETLDPEDVTGWAVSRPEEWDSVDSNEYQRRQEARTVSTTTIPERKD